MTTVETSFSCVYLIPGCEPHQGRVTLNWEHTAPFQVNLTFDNVDDTQVVWTVSRDVFADVLLSPPGPKFGGGDFTVDRGLASMGIELHGEGGDASVSFPLQPVIMFMQQTLLQVPRGEAEAQIIATEMDTWLNDVLENG